ncbi:MAG: TrkH family potassium uptake protein [Deltaproteobacteria bacterium]
MNNIRAKIFLSRHLPPARIFILSFAGVILLGALALWLPFSASKNPLTFVDALFMSTSGVCVTGLVTVDIGKDLSLTGQVITMVLFQIGGLGIITFSVFLFRIMGRGISFKEREIIQSVFMHTPRRDFFVILKSVLVSTFIIEAVGTLLLFIRFSRDFPWGQALYASVYHAVSAFNNCGFSLFSDSLIGYRSDWIVNLTIMGLLILGGMGFIVLHELVVRWKGRQKTLSVHTKIALITTGFLIVSGALLLYIFERHAMVKEMDLHTTLLVSFFQAVSPRTCGFNTVDLALLTNEAILIIMILMFIGACPGSTGGGIKTTSAALLVLMMWNRFKGHDEVNVFNRTIPKEILTRTISIIVASAFSVALIFSALLLAGGATLPPPESRHHFVEYLFETISAFGTVGLSMNVTPKLNEIQKIAVIIMMFAGRVGPLTLAFSFAAASSKKGITYAEETVMVG